MCVSTIRSVSSAVAAGTDSSRGIGLCKLRSSGDISGELISSPAVVRRESYVQAVTSETRDDLLRVNLSSGRPEVSIGDRWTVFISVGWCVF